MATVTGLTAARMLAIEGASIVGGHITSGHLILEKFGGGTIDAGSVIGPTGPAGPTFVVCTSGTRPGSPTTGTAIYETDTKLIRIWDGTRWKLQERIIGTSTGRPAMTAGDTGVELYETDTGLEYVWTGTKWFLTATEMPLFANAAARDAAIAVGERKLGMTVYLTAEGGLFTWNGTKWWGHPNGEVGSVVGTADSAILGFSAGTPSATSFRISGYSIAVNVPANRILVAEFNGMMAHNTADYIASLGIWRVNTQVAQNNIHSDDFDAHVRARCTGLAGAQTFYLWGWVNAVQPTVIDAAGVYPAVFTVTDVGST